MRSDDAGIGNMLDVVDLDDATIARRKAFLEFTDEDVARLRHLHGALQGYAPVFAKRFYEHILSFDETRALVSEPGTLDRLQRSQAAYFESLTAGDYGRDYIQHRLRVGRVHHRVGLAPTWYLGAYAQYMNGLLPEIQRRLGDNPDVFTSTVESLIKIVLLDMGLAIDTYIEARDQTILGLKNYAEMVFDSMHDGIFVLSPQLAVLSSNRTCVQMFGLAPQRLLGRHLTEVLNAEGLEQCAEKVARGGVEQHGLPFLVGAVGSGQRKTVRVTIKHVCLADAEGRLLMVIEEVSEQERFRKQAEHKLAHSESMLRRAQAVAKIGSWRMDPSGEEAQILECSDETYRLFDLPMGTSVSFQTILERVHPDDRQQLHAVWLEALRGVDYRVEHRIKVRGATVWLENRVEVEFDALRRLVSISGTVQDITERKVAEVRIEQLAFYDALTGLPNRTLFQDRLQQALAMARRYGQVFALLFVDIDRFKEINDTQGHACGDRVLTAVAQRFRAALRDDETLARLGGDEFVIIAHHAGREGAGRIADRLLQALKEPVEAWESTFVVRASTGIALYPEDGEDSQQLLKHADIAMYRAKAGSGGYCFYGAEMGAALTRRMDIAQRLARALAESGLELHYQPQCDLRTGALTGAEALLRWHDAEWGWVSPSEFIPVAEERGMMLTLGEWVLERACRQLQVWDKAGLKLPGRVAINVATQQIEQHDFASKALAIADALGVAPTRIELEITESSMMLDPEIAMAVTRRLVDAGFAFAIDDFGTGHSSLSYLKRFPAQTLKIDMSFVRQMLSDRNDYSIVTTIIAMARSLGLKTLAEGVEELAQADSLLALGCDEAQGYFFGRPVAPDDFAAMWLKKSAGSPEC